MSEKNCFVHAVLLSVCAAPALARAGTPAIYNLGTFAGLTSSGSAINASGQVTGSSGITTTGIAVSHAFLYTGGVMLDLGTLGSTNSFGSAINAGGQVVGSSELPLASPTPSCTAARRAAAVRWPISARSAAWTAMAWQST